MHDIVKGAGNVHEIDGKKPLPSFNSHGARN